MIFGCVTLDIMACISEPIKIPMVGDQSAMCLSAKPSEPQPLGSPLESTRTIASEPQTYVLPKPYFDAARAFRSRLPRVNS